MRLALVDLLMASPVKQYDVSGDITLMLGEHPFPLVNVVTLGRTERPATLRTGCLLLVEELPSELSSGRLGSTDDNFACWLIPWA
jgi:hypothetical protein